VITKSPPITVVRIFIIILAVGTAMIHAYLNVEMKKIDPLFTLNALGYLGLMGAYLLPIPFLQKYLPMIWWVFTVFTAVTILAWAIIGRPYTNIGYVDKTIEVLLIIMLIIDRQSRRG
jgi:hypothetical protein